MSFTGLEPTHCSINMGPVSSFMGNIAGVLLVTHHQQECDGVPLHGHPQELIFWVAVNCHLKRRGGLG